MKKHTLFIVVLLLLLLVIKIKDQTSLQGFVYTPNIEHSNRFFAVQSIDTMKYSRDIAREKLNDQLFDSVINQQVKLINQTGATHVAIGTPYDSGFLPILRRWVKKARENNLKVWFRGNFSGWEGWFGYPKIDRKTHINMSREFILNNPDLFENGDIFTSCPECENGGPGDPRSTGDVNGHRQFLIDLYKSTKQSFEQIGKKVASNYFSMNGDVARFIMDKKTTKELDGIVVIDHYVASADQLIFDVNELAGRSDGKIVLGEFGAPIPDIHGKMSEEQQAQWLNITLEQLIKNEHVAGINYWTNVGSSTQLWNSNAAPRKAVSILQKAYKPNVFSARVVNELTQPIQDTLVKGKERETKTDANGIFSLLYQDENQQVEIRKEGYKTTVVDPVNTNLSIVLVKEHEDLWFTVMRFIKLLNIWINTWINSPGL